MRQPNIHIPNLTIIEMILRQILFGLIIITSIKSLIKKYELLFSTYNVDDYLVHQTRGQIGKENFTYYSLYEEGNIKILLESNDGDADLYISSIKKPEIEPHLYDVSSITCGNDLIELPSEMKRPIIVGVYGHPSFDKTTYTLSMYVNLNDYQLNEVEEESITMKQQKDFSIKEKLNFLMRYTALWRIFEIVEGIFFML